MDGPEFEGKKKSVYKFLEKAKHKDRQQVRGCLGLEVGLGIDCKWA